METVGSLKCQEDYPYSSSSFSQEGINEQYTIRLNSYDQPCCKKELQDVSEASLSKSSTLQTVSIHDSLSKLRPNDTDEQTLVGSKDKIETTITAERVIAKRLSRWKMLDCFQNGNSPLEILDYVYCSYFKDWWALEILGVLFSVACLIAIVTVLSIYSERPLSAWKMPISINSSIALFAALAKSAMLFPIAACIGQLKWPYFLKSRHSLMELQRFDEASRGPFGALHLIFRLGRASLIASFGSLLIFAALAIDPFAQQIISYPSRMVPVANNSATITTTQIYDTSASDYGSSSTSSSTDIKMQGAIYRGLYSLPVSPPFQCASGSCEWPTFISLGTCSSCVNVTAESQRSCFTTRGTGELDTEVLQNDSRSSYYPMACNYTTPQRFNMWSNSSFLEGGGKNPDATVIDSIARSYNMYNTSDDTIMTMAILRLPEDPTGLERPFGEIHECRLYWCARRYPSVRVIDGDLQTGDTDILSLKFDGRRVGGYQRPVPYGTFKLQDSLVDNSFNETFTINLWDLSTMSFFLATIFTIAETSTVQPGAQGICFGLALRQAENTTQLMERLADSMSDLIRSGDNATQISGTMNQSVTFIHVNWVWLILPATLIISACALLALMIILTSKPDRVLWKSSSLALLFHGLDQKPGVSSSPALGCVRSEDEERNGATKTLSEMERLAKGLPAQLIRDKAGGDLKFVAA